MTSPQHHATPASSNDTDEGELDRILGLDPTGVYAEMDAATREQYRQACRELATWSQRTPVEVAREAIRFSEQCEAEDPRGRHVGTQLLAEGRPRLETCLGCHVPWAERAARIARRHAAGAYIGSLLGSTAIALVGVERLLAVQGLEGLHRVLLVLTLALPLLELLHEGLDSVLTRMTLGLAPLPRLEPERVLSQDTRTLVVTPLLVTSPEDIEAQLRRLEINYLGNSAPDLYFALLTDFRDAPTKELPEDRELLERLERGLRELNERHGYREQPRFLLLHRERRWNPVAGRWMGWERKRGKLEELNRLVLGAGDTSYTLPVPELVRTVRYVLTLDADTHLLPGSAARLVATLHHPLNRARLDATGRRVVAGYSMLQPAMEDGPTRALWLASERGWPSSILRKRKQHLPPQALTRMSQAFFGVGEFLGKGLYDVAAFTHSLEDRIPENAVLSHDKLEGMFARVAFVHDARLFESRSMDIASTARIWHRWIRGDWQLLPWIFPRVPSRDGRRVPNPLPLLDRWKLLTDLRRSLSAPAALLALVGGWLWLPADDVWGWTLGAVLWFCRRPVAYTVRMARSQGSLAAGLRSVLTSAPRVLIGSFLNLAFLLPLSGLALDAIFRALYRLAFDRSRILDWTTHAQASRKVSGLSSFALPEVWGGMALALGILGVLTLFNPEALPWASPPVLAWLPLVAFVRRGRSAPAAREARPAELDWLRTLARRSWELYAQRVPTGRELSWDTAELSPTDLALGLLAPLSAYHLGCLGLDELVSRLGESLAALAEHERHRGHLFARYDARERRPVSPRHISTAESGVLAAALVVLESGLRAARAEGQPARLEAVEAQARALREEMDFAFLYDGAVDLFHTGYDVESRSLDGAHHGLLASGALLAGFVAIARGQVPLRHWLALLESDQRLRAAGELPTGQSTEHLLPALFLWFPPATLLAQAARTAVDAAFERDAVRGAPQLAVLALRFSPGRALAELRREEARCVHGRCGLLLLAAVANQVCEDILVQHFHQHWQTAWVEALIYETKDAA